MLGWPDPGAAFTAVIQLGTMLAVLLFFWRDIVRISWAWLRSLRNKEMRQELDVRMGWYIILGTIPISVAGLLFADQIEGPARNLWLNAAMLIAFGLLLLVAEQWGSKRKNI